MVGLKFFRSFIVFSTCVILSHLLVHKYLRKYTFPTNLLYNSQSSIPAHSISRLSSLKIAWCAPHIHSGSDPHAIEHWMRYHVALGIEKVIAYADNTDKKLEKIFQDRNFSLIYNEEKMDKYYNQEKLIQDCFYRTQYYDWVFFGDFDEYLYWSSNDTYVWQLLDKYSKYDCLSFGKHLYSKSISNSLLPFILKQLWTTKHAFCWPRSGSVEFNANCINVNGRRKYAIQPKRIKNVKTLRVHSCDQYKHQQSIFNFDTRSVHLKEWWGLLKANYWIDTSDKKDVGLIHYPQSYGDKIQFTKDEDYILFYQNRMR